MSSSEYSSDSDTDLDSDSSVPSASKRAKNTLRDETNQEVQERETVFQEVFGNEDSDCDYQWDIGAPVDSDDDGDGDDELSSWKIGERVPMPPKFTGKRGLLVELPESPGMSDYLGLFITDEVLDIIVEETNRYADQYTSSHRLKRHSRFHSWKPTCVGEIRSFLALIYAMGLVKQLEIHEYWTRDEVTSTPFFPKVMPRDRFLLLLTFFHLKNNDNYIPPGQDGYEPLFKLGKVYKLITESFTNSFYPGANVAIDEGLVAWRGNLHFRVYNPDKPDKFGIKSYELCDAKSGYCCQFEFYTGKTSTPPSANGVTYDLCMKQMTPYLDKGHVLYVDNYYTSPKLFWDLYKRNTGACGTLRTNRKFVPPQIKVAKFKKKGEKLTMSNGPLTITKWHV